MQAYFNVYIMFCKNCGAEISENAVICVKCGCAVNNDDTKVIKPNGSEKDWLTTLLLCFFLGGFGGHSFYAGKTAIGIIQLLTLGVCGIWTLIDFIMILCGNYTDAEGKVISNKR